MLRVCVVGLGHIGNLHADIYQDNSEVELVGVCDLLKDRAETAGTRLGVPWFLDAAEMLKELAPDLVSVATGGYEYASDHYEPTIQAFEAGCHVLCEKPIHNEISKAEEMVAKAAEKKLCFGVDFNHRFTPAGRLAKRWVEEGRLGDLLFANIAMWIGKFQELDSVYYHLKALHPHSMDMLRYFCGEVRRVHCFGLKAPGRNLYSTASANFQFANGMVGHLTGSYDIERGHPMERVEVAGTKGRFVWEDMWREVTLYPAGNLEKTVYTNPVFGGYTGFPDTFACRINTFVDQVAAGASPDEIDGSGLDGLKAQRIIAAMIKSIETDSVVDVDN